MSARSRGATLRQLANASSAAANANMPSATVASATDAIISPVAGSSTSNVPPPSASRHRPPMNNCVLTPSTPRVSSAVAPPSRDDPGRTQPVEQRAERLLGVAKPEEAEPAALGHVGERLDLPAQVAVGVPPRHQAAQLGGPQVVLGDDRAPHVVGPLHLGL